MYFNYSKPQGFFSKCSYTGGLAVFSWNSLLKKKLKDLQVCLSTNWVTSLELWQVMLALDLPFLDNYVGEYCLDLGIPHWRAERMSIEENYVTLRYFFCNHCWEQKCMLVLLEKKKRLNTFWKVGMDTMTEK